MATAWVETPGETAPPLAAGMKVKGEFRCQICGYGVTIHRELPPCPMCRGDSWEPVAWTPFGTKARRAS